MVRAHDFTDAGSLLYSVVIPVYRSADFLADTVGRTLDYFRSKGWKCEIVLVNDASPDDSWLVIERLAAENPEVVGVDLLKNAGQHNANFIGLEHATGDVVVTMDDDLQNPPEEIGKLAERFVEGHDLVVGRFEQKRHSGFRRFGSEFVQWINRRIFPAPEGFRHTNFRMIGRDVVERMLSYTTHYPYTSALPCAWRARRPMSRYATTTVSPASPTTTCASWPNSPGRSSSTIPSSRCAC